MFIFNSDFLQHPDRLLNIPDKMIVHEVDAWFSAQFLIKHISFQFFISSLCHVFESEPADWWVFKPIPISKFVFCYLSADIYDISKSVNISHAEASFSFFLETQIHVQQPGQIMGPWVRQLRTFFRRRGRCQAMLLCCQGLSLPARR